MAQSSHRTASKHRADGTTRAYQWESDDMPHERIGTLMAHVETCTRFTDTEVTVDWEHTSERYVEILLTTHDRILSPELMGVLSEHDAVIELQTSHGRWEKSEWLVALPVE